MDKSSAVSDGTSGISRPAHNMTNKRRSNTPDQSATSSSATTGSQNSKQSSANNSVGPSPLASRDSSPTRRPRRAASANRLAGTRSRKNSQTDNSPSRQTRPSISSAHHHVPCLRTILPHFSFPRNNNKFKHQLRRSQASTQTSKTVRDGPYHPVCDRPLPSLVPDHRYLPAAAIRTSLLLVCSGLHPRHSPWSRTRCRRARWRNRSFHPECGLQLELWRRFKKLACQTRPILPEAQH
jgi:hypothetical protein